jgi:hypothetical protein
MTGCRVLTEERWRQLMDNTLPDADSDELQEHLASDCEACEEFFERMDAAGEQQLRHVFSTAGTPPDPGLTETAMPPFHTVMREVRRGRQSLWRRWREREASFQPMLWIGSTAAVLLVVAAVLVPGVWGPQQTAKGPAVSASSLRLEFAIGRQDDAGRLTVDRGRLGGAYRTTDRLFLRYELSTSGYVYLVSRRADGRIMLLFPADAQHPLLQPAGAHLANADESGGFPLSGFEGRSVIIGVFSPAPLDLQRQIVPMVQGVDPAAGAIEQHAVSNSGVAIEAIYFDVRA